MKKIILALSVLCIAKAAKAELYFECELQENSASRSIPVPREVTLDIASSINLRENGRSVRNTIATVEDYIVTVSHTKIRAGAVDKVSYVFDVKLCDTLQTGIVIRESTTKNTDGSVEGSASQYNCMCSAD